MARSYTPLQNGRSYSNLAATKSSDLVLSRIEFRNGRPNFGQETSITSPSRSITPEPKLNASAPKKWM